MKRRRNSESMDKIKLLKEGFEWASILGSSIAMLVCGAVFNNMILAGAGAFFGALSYHQINKIIKQLQL